MRKKLHLGPFVSDGSRRLSGKLATTTQVAFATLTGISQGALSELSRGWSRPGPLHQAILRRHARIPLGAWITDDDRKVISGHRSSNRTAKRATRNAGRARSRTAARRSSGAR